MMKLALSLLLVTLFAAIPAEAKPKKPVRRLAPRAQNCVRPFYYGAPANYGNGYGFYSL